jgi:EAL domain-containing protein (putative c-di-GMP-specific phosphodiesterase class I)
MFARPQTYATFNVTGSMLDGTDQPGARWLEKLIERIPSDRLVLEIVESAIVMNVARVVALVDDLRGRGIRIALDDFGTGLSNLERLRRFPADFVKIDRAFTSNLGTGGREEAIVGALCRLSGDLGFEVVAEGVETDEQAATLRGLGVKYGQGWLFGAPASRIAD